MVRLLRIVNNRANHAVSCDCARRLPVNRQKGYFELDGFASLLKTTKACLKQRVTPSVLVSDDANARRHDPAGARRRPLRRKEWRVSVATVVRSSRIVKSIAPAPRSSDNGARCNAHAAQWPLRSVRLPICRQYAASTLSVAPTTAASMLVA